MYSKLYKTKKEIESWLIENHVDFYEIIEDNDYKYIVNVNSNVNLSAKVLDFIPVKFNIIHGNFNVCFNYLRTLEFVPKIIYGNFDCSFNDLKELDFFPEKVEKSCNINNNNFSDDIYKNIVDFEKIYEIYTEQKKIKLIYNLDKSIIINNHKIITKKI